MTKCDRGGVTTMFSANPHLEVITCFAPPCHSDLNEFAHSCLVKSLKRVGGKDFFIEIIRQEASHIVTRKTKTHLREIVGPKREELRRLRHLTRCQCRSWRFD